MKTRILVSIALLFPHALWAIIGGDFVSDDQIDNPASYNTVGIARTNGDNFKVFCSGSIIAQEYILTARHCTVDRDVETLRVLFHHDENTAADADYFSVAEKWEYKGEQHWQSEFPNNDVAILRLNRTIPRNYRPLNMTTSLQEKSLESLLQNDWLIAGYGNQNPQLGSIISGQNKWLGVELREYLNTTFFRHILFLQAPEGSGGCHGDSGGPVYRKVETSQGVHWEIAGMANGFDMAITDGSMHDTGDPDFPVIARCDSGEILYGFIGNYLSWIEDMTGLDFSATAPQRQKLDLSSVEKICQTALPSDSQWRTLKTLAIKVLDDRDPGESEREVLTNCARISELLLNRETLRLGQEDDLGGLEILRHLSSLRELSFDSVDVNSLDIESLAFQANDEGEKSFLSLLSFRNGDVENIEQIMKFADAFKVEQLRLPSNKIDSLAGIENFESLISLDLANNQVDDLQGIESLNTLEELTLTNNLVSNIAPLKSLGNLKSLRLRRNFIETLELASFAGRLRALDISYNPVSELSGLLGHRAQMQVLNLSHTSLGGAQLEKEISQLGQLKELELAQLQLNSSGFLAQLNSLERLNLLGTGLNEVTAFEEGRHAHLRWLNLSRNNLVDLRPLRKLSSLSTLWPLGNPVDPQLCPQGDGPRILQSWCQRLQ